MASRPVSNFGIGTKITLKQYNGAVYVFAMPTDTGTNSGVGKKTFTVPAPLRGKKVIVVGENRTIALNDTTFTDSFANVNSYHAYKIAWSHDPHSAPTGHGCSSGREC